MQVETYAQNENNAMNPRNTKRLTPVDYANAGILKLYNRTAKDREAHDKQMQKYRQYLMKLCTLSDDSSIQECEETE